MTRPVVIIDPASSGIELAPAFKARGIPAIAVTFNTHDFQGFGVNIHPEDFIKLIPHQANLEGSLKPYDPIAIIPGTEEAVSLADSLSLALTPHLANDPKKSLNRIHKAHMQQALEEAGLPFIKTLNTNSEGEVREWLKDNDLINSPLIIKPPISAGSDKVFHIAPGDEWKAPFNRVLTEPAKTTGKVSKTVVVQEEAIGTEFAVGTVSCNSKHYLSHLIQYNKKTFNDRKTVYDYVEFIPFDKIKHGALFDYTQEALDALGVKWGAAHNEIMLTQNGPRLIETGARMCGGPVVRFSREATGSSQADKLAEIYLDGTPTQANYQFKKTVMPVFLSSPTEGRISNISVFDNVTTLPTFLSKHLWFNEGTPVPKTIDYLSSIGIIALSGDRKNVLLDYAKIREMESRLLIK